MAEEKLNKDLISDPQMWRLSLELNDQALEVVIQSAIADQALIHRSIPISSDNGSVLAQLEAAIYDNQLLLSDFGKIDFLMASRRFLITPDSITDDDMREDLMSTLWPGTDYTIIDNKLSNSGCTMLIGIDTALLAFVRRTFPTVRIMHRLSPIITYFYNKDRLNNSTKLYVHITNTKADVILISNGRLKMANTFDAPDRQDMLYYILSVAQNSDFAMDKDELMLCGLPAIRESLSTDLRKYINYVMPVVFPSAVYRAGKEAFESPFELIILPLCE